MPLPFFHDASSAPITFGLSRFLFTSSWIILSRNIIWNHLSGDVFSGVFYPHLHDFTALYSVQKLTTSCCTTVQYSGCYIPKTNYNTHNLCWQLVLRQPDFESVTLLCPPELNGSGQVPDPGKSTHRISSDLRGRIQRKFHQIPKSLLSVLCSTTGLFW